jgi:predicted metal-dependent hydrolase
MTDSVVESCVGYSVLPSKGRKGIYLRVGRDGAVTVRAPRFVAKSYIEQFVVKKARWIVKRQKHFEQLKTLHPPKEFKGGENFQFFGRDLRLSLRRSPDIAAPVCRMGSGGLTLFLNAQSGEEFKAAAAGAVRDLYVRHTAASVAAYVRRHSGPLAVKPERVAVANQKRCWGTCSHKGDIRVNWRLAMMPPAVIEYIVVHELCHIKVHNHSPKFWNLVRSILPDCMERRAWLRRHSSAIFQMSAWTMS